MKKRIYISGPMTGYVDYNLPEFARAAKELRKKGYEVVSPSEIKLPQYPQGFTPKNDQEDVEMWTAFMRADIKQLMDCDIVATLDGWMNSKGARIEVGLAEGLGMEIYKVEELIEKRVSA